MPIQPNFLERAAFFTFNAAPGVLIDLAGALGYQALSTAVQLGVFTELAKGGGTVPELGVRLGVSERGLGALMPALAATGYVQASNGHYQNSPLTQKWLINNDAFNAKSLHSFWDAAIRELWAHAPDVIRTDERPYNFYEWVEADSELNASFQETLVMSAHNTGDDIAKKLSFPAKQARLLDVGGGHGVYSMICCRHFPQLHATILDSPAALGIAEKYRQEQGMIDRITLKPGDLWQLDWGKGFDTILLFNLLHHYDTETNHKLLQKAAAALKPGGTVAVLDQIEGNVPGNVPKAFIRLIALQYYLFANGRVFSKNEMSGMLQAAGFAGIQYHAMSKAPGTSLLLAHRV
jgi:2-polyprenyl-3-methyl-5-hydroxy-6-metoxy-1,4-benzoquinol methylase